MYMLTSYDVLSVITVAQADDAVTSCSASLTSAACLDEVSVSVV